MNFSFPPGKYQDSQKFSAESPKIGWLQAKSKAGAKFDITIKDGLGRVVHKSERCGNKDSEQYGELINLPVNIGDDLELEVTNVKGTDSIDVYVN